MSDFKEWSKIEKKYWLSAFNGCSIKEMENGLLITRTDGSIVKSFWFEELHSFLKNQFKEIDSVYAYTVHYTEDDDFIYFADFKVHNVIYRYYIKERYNGLTRELEQLDTSFNFETSMIDNMSFGLDDNIHFIYKLCKAADEFVFNLPKYRLRILLNQLSVSDDFNLWIYMKDNGLLEKENAK